MKESRSRVGKLEAQPVENSFDRLAVALLSFHTADNVKPIVPLTLHVQGHQSNKAGDLRNNLVELTTKSNLCLIQADLHQEVNEQCHASIEGKGAHCRHPERAPSQ